MTDREDKLKALWQLRKGVAVMEAVLEGYKGMAALYEELLKIDPDDAMGRWVWRIQAEQFTGTITGRIKLITQARYEDMEEVDGGHMGHSVCGQKVD